MSPTVTPPVQQTAGVLQPSAPSVPTGRQNQARPSTRMRDEKGGKFRILVGVCLEDGPPGCDCDQCAGGNAGNHTYRARTDKDPPDYTGDIIVSKRDLVRRCNQGNSRKFEYADERAIGGGNNAELLSAQEEIARLREQLAAAQAGPNKEALFGDLSKMNEKELRDLAAREEIDVSKCRNVPDLVKAIKAAA